MSKTIVVLTRRPALLRRCAVGVFALVLAGLPTTWLAAPAVSRADGECAPGWAWRPRWTRRAGSALDMSYDRTATPGT